MIRQFEFKDAESCCALVRECLGNDRSLSPRLREQLRISETPQSMEERARLFYMAVYESRDKILGIAGLDLNEIRILCVSPEQRRMGIGRALLDFIQSMVPAALFPDIFVYSSIEGKDFYRASGFIEKGPVSFDMNGDQLRTVFMTLPLR